jgi:hypothetical protein
MHFPLTHISPLAHLQTPPHLSSPQYPTKHLGVHFEIQVVLQLSGEWGHGPPPGQH